MACSPDRDPLGLSAGHPPLEGGELDQAGF